MTGCPGWVARGPARVAAERDGAEILGAPGDDLGRPAAEPSRQRSRWFSMVSTLLHIILYMYTVLPPTPKRPARR